MDYFLMRCSWWDDRRSGVFDDYDFCVVWCYAFNWFNPILIDRLHSWIVAYRTSRMPGDSPMKSSDGLLVLYFDSHFRIWWDFEIERFGVSEDLHSSGRWTTNMTLSSLLLWHQMTSLPVLLLSAVLTALEIFPFRWIVDVVVVFWVVYDFFPIECLADVARHDPALPCFHAFSEANRGQVNKLVVSGLIYWVW